MSDEENDNTENTEGVSSKFAPLRIDVIRPNCPFNFDLYIKVNEKYILYIRKGDDIDDERLEKLKTIEKLKAKSVDRLFTTEEDAKVFDEYMHKTVDDVVEDPDLEADERFDAIQEIAATAIEVTFNDPESIEAYKLTEKSAQGLRKVVQDNPGALKNVFKKNQKSKVGGPMDYLIDHCNNVAALAIRMAFACGFRGEDLDNIGTAALLHDIGLTTIKKEELDILFFRPPKIMSPDDKRIYNHHVEDGIKIAERNDFVSPAVIKLIKMHEENKAGDGYPEKASALEPLEEILSIVNCFEKKVVAYKMGAIGAFKDLQINEVGRYSLPMIKKLKEVLESEEVFELS